MTSLVNTQEHTSNQYFTTEADAQAGTSELNSTTISPGTSTSVYVLYDRHPTLPPLRVVPLSMKFRVQVNPLPIVALTNTEICFGDSIELTDQINTTYPYVVLFESRRRERTKFRNY